MTHELAMDRISNCEARLSYSEAVAVYLRSRGILNDGAQALSDAVPDGWGPATAASAWDRVLACDELQGTRAKLSINELQKIISTIFKQ